MIIDEVRLAGVAQLVEQLIRNQQVRGSNPRAGSKYTKGFQIIIFGIPFLLDVEKLENRGKSHKVLHLVW